ncbi:MAG: hypothetical protein LC104_14340 [Bacteroidales bacterium]|nr:hypothetical protein [Bacteroidales bacterium]
MANDALLANAPSSYPHTHGFAAKWQGHTEKIADEFTRAVTNEHLQVTQSDTRLVFDRVGGSIPWLPE